jgi:hypothetical protein
MTVQEEWRPIPGFEGIYEVSDQGNVRSLDRITPMPGGSSRRTAGRVLRPSHGGRNLYHLYVHLSRDGEAHSHAVHQIVATVFHGPRPTPLSQVRHLNGISEDNRAVNLQWGTGSENQNDRVKHGNNHNANKIRCKWGHLLKDPNIGNNPSTPGARPCRSCTRAWGARIKQAKRGEPVGDFKTIADAAYEKIMAGQPHR